MIRQIKADMEQSEENSRKYMQVFKLANLGNMLGGTLHTFNNILGGILGYSQLIKYELAEDSDIYRQAGIIENATRRASKLISQIQHFSQRETYRKKIINPKVVIEQTVDILETTIRKNIQITTDLNHGRATINADISSICHALLNLAFNADEAMPGGGELSISTRLVETKKNCPKSALSIMVRDTGQGIKHDDLPHIFDPFFTTQKERFAPGMGLTITRSILEYHEGAIDVESQPGGGTTVMISLPIANATTQASPAGTYHEASPGTGNGELIMVVDDEADLRNMTKRILEKRGYRVLLAESGEIAMALFEQHSAEIELVILDMILPGVNGSDVYRSLKQIRSNSKVILTSGYLNDPPFQAILDQTSDPFIRKPWDLTELLEHTQRALAAN